MQQQLPQVTSAPQESGVFTRFVESAGLLHSRTRLPALVFAALLILFEAQRLVIVLTLPDRFADASAGALARAFLVGMRFDVVVAGMALVPLLPMLALATPKMLRRRWYKRLVGWYCGLVISICGFICIVDYFFYRQFTERLDARAVSYIGEEGNEYLLHILITRYPLIPAILVALATIVVMSAAAVRWGFDDRRAESPFWQAILWPAIIIPLVVLGIRGTVSSHAINSSFAYFGSTAAVSQLTLNGIFTLRQAMISSMVKSVEIDRLYPVLPHDEAVKRVVALATSPQDTLAGDPRNPLRRTTRTGRPQRDCNVVLVVLESLSWHYIGALGGDPRLTPNLNRLADEGMLFERCFAVGERTQRGFAGIVSGFPDLPEYSVTTRPDVTGRFITLGSVLARRGYDTSFIYAGPGHRDHRQSFLGSNGYSRFVTIDDVVTRTFSTKLGYCDEDLFNTADATFRASKRPFFATLLTLSFHSPFLIPDNTIEPVEPGHPHAAQLDCIRYTDWTIGRFMDKARQSDYFDNTIFVFVADHMGGYRENPTTPATYRVPFLVYAPGVIGTAPQRIPHMCSQMDIPPTIMWLLGGEYEHCFFGSSVLGPGGDGRYAIAVTGDEELIFYDSGGRIAVVPPYGGAGTLYRYAPPEQLTKLSTASKKWAKVQAEAQRNAVAVIQTAQWLFEHGEYRVPAPQDRR